MRHNIEVHELNSGSEAGKRWRGHKTAIKKLVSFYVKGNLIFSPVHSAWNNNTKREAAVVVEVSEQYLYMGCCLI